MPSTGGVPSSRSSKASSLDDNHALSPATRCLEILGFRITGRVRFQTRLVGTLMCSIERETAGSYVWRSACEQREIERR